MIGIEALSVLYVGSLLQTLIAMLLPRKYSMPIFVFTSVSMIMVTLCLVIAVVVAHIRWE